MSAPVDVLAVMDAVQRRLDDSFGNHSFPEFEKARAAVAELIEAVQKAKTDLCRQRLFGSETLQGWRNQATYVEGDLEEALARVQGRYDTPSGHDVGCVEHPPGHASACSCGARVQGEKA